MLKMNERTQIESIQISLFNLFAALTLLKKQKNDNKLKTDTKK